MEDELLAACQHLLRQGLPGSVPRELDDEHRFIPVGLSIDEDLAVTAFVRRLPAGSLAGGPGLQVSKFHQRDGNWEHLGGKVSNFRGYPLAERRPAAVQGSYLRAIGYGETRLSEPRRFPRSAGYVFHLVLRAAAEVYWLQAGARVLDVPFHGHAVLAWATRRAPAVVAIGPDGSRLARMKLSRDPFEIRYRPLPLPQYY
jgi:hypothetical protein